MKHTLGMLAGLLFAFSSFAQATVAWNSPTGPITTNGFQGNSGPMSGVNAYRFGLYAGPTGSPLDSLTLLGLTTNNFSIPGTFTPVSSVLLPFANGEPISFQVRGWSLFAGANYASALSYALSAGSPLAYLGTSGVGAYIVGSGVPLQSAAFVLTPVPEPSSLLLGTLGIILTLLLCPRRASQQKPPQP
jgi:hypothetical protein